jgi:hypothetical protein
LQVSCLNDTTSNVPWAFISFAWAQPVVIAISGEKGAMSPKNMRITTPGGFSPPPIDDDRVSK